MDNNFIIEISGNKTGSEIRDEIIQAWITTLIGGVPQLGADRFISIYIDDNDIVTVFPWFTETQKIRYPEFFDKVNRIEIVEAPKMENLTYLNVFKNLEMFYLGNVSTKLKELPDFFYTSFKDTLKHLIIYAPFDNRHIIHRIFNFNEKIKDIKLTELYIGNYILSESGQEYISNIETLETIIINQPRIHIPYPKIDFSKLTNLKKIIINKTIHFEIESLKLKQLNDIIRLPNLTYLKICGLKKIDTHPFIDGDLPKIEELIINDLVTTNSFFSPQFFPTINKLVTLKSLELINNGIRNFPNLDKCIHLEIINLSKNKLGRHNDIPEDHIKNLTKLKELNLSYNHLRILPDNIGNLVNLKKLIVNNNMIENLPDNIGNLVNLE